MSNHPHYQYPQTAPGTYPVNKASSYVYSSRAYLNSGVFGAIVGGTSVLAINLHKVQENQMTLKHAITDSLAKGAGAGVATAAGAAVASSVGGGLMSFVFLAATATGVGYLLNSVGKSVSEKAVNSQKESS